MKKDNLVELIELLMEDEEPETGLEDGQVDTSDGTIVTL